MSIIGECKTPKFWPERVKLEMCLILFLIFTGAFAIEKETTTPNPDNVCKTQSCIYSAEAILRNMDPTIAPCDDFYNFACGKFSKRIIPEDQEIINGILLLNNRVKEQMRNMLEEPLQKGEPKAFRLMKKIYKTCMDTDAIEKDGLKTIRSILKDLGGWPILEGDQWDESKFDWKELPSKYLKIGVGANPFFHVYVINHLKNSTRRVLCVKDIAISRIKDGIRTKRNVKTNPGRAYYQYALDVAILFGANMSKSVTIMEINDMFDLQVMLWRLRDRFLKSGNDPVEEMTINQLQQKIPNITWVEYINQFLTPHNISITGDDVIFVYKQKLLKALVSLLTTVPKRIMANFILWKVIDESSSFLNKAIRDAHLKYLKIKQGVANYSSRWSECVENFMGESASLYIGSGAQFARKYFNNKTKQDAHEMFLSIHHTFQDTMKNIEWMDPQTKKNALEKLKVMIINTAYPDEFLDDEKLHGFYSSLDLDDNNYLKSFLKLSQFDIRNHFRKLRQPFERNNWINRGFVNRVGAFQSVQENSVYSPAAILQEQMFNKDRPHYLNYAAIGTVMGHEMIHGFDSRGSKYDKDGNKVNWWTPQSENIFKQKAQCFVEQYNKYVVPDLNKTVNGTLTLAENIADNGGFALSYKAYQDWVKKHGVEQTLPGLNYTQNQLFWIALANVWCSKARIQIQQENLLDDMHAPDRFRVIGTLSNNEDFSKDFRCSSESKMNPKKKCKLW